MATAGRTGYQQSVGTGWETVFQAQTHGDALKGVDLTVSGQDIEVRITGIHDTPSGLVTERITVNTTVSRFATTWSGRPNITRIEAKSVAVGGILSWFPAAV